MKNLKYVRKNEGITLIALVVTIVVLLILAGVSISMLTGEQGIIKQAQETKNQTIIGKEKEAISLAYSSCKADNIMKNVTDEKLQAKLIDNGENASVSADGDNLIVFFNETKHRYTVNQKGKIDEIKELTAEEKIIDILFYITNYQGEIQTNYAVVTAGGEVKWANNVWGNMFNKIEATNEIITNSGIRSKSGKYFVDNQGKVYEFQHDKVVTCISDMSGSELQGKNITDIDMDEYQRTVIARDSDGKIYTWGSGRNSALGDGTTEGYRNIPKCISDIPGSELQGKNIIDIYINASTVIARDVNRKVYTWGYASGGGRWINMPQCINEIEESELYNKKVESVNKDKLLLIYYTNENAIYVSYLNEY